jgi:phosphatidylserine/phosphatidylglycerophosphate/cardiolipin synthase-like enzyme
VLEEAITLLGTATDTGSVTARMGQHLPNAVFRRTFSDLLAIWCEESPEVSPRSLALALASAAHSMNRARESSHLSLVWTGPDGYGSPARRTAIVLQQLVDSARRELTLISFAIYNVPEIVRALERALDRGVSLRFIAETPESGEGKIAFGLMDTLDRQLLSRSEVYIWPKAKRPADGRGRYGSLHVKAAVADGEHLLITSANLTEYALALNMEMGLLVKNPLLGRQVTELFNRLILDEILVPVNSDRP